MNNGKRKNISLIIDQMNDLKDRLTELLEDERDYFYNIPENLQGSDPAQKSENAIDFLHCAISYIEEVTYDLEMAIR